MFVKSDLYLKWDIEIEAPKNERFFFPILCVCVDKITLKSDTRFGMISSICDLYPYHVPWISGWILYSDDSLMNAGLNVCQYLGLIINRLIKLGSYAVLFIPIIKSHGVYCTYYVRSAVFFPFIRSVLSSFRFFHLNVG